MTDQRDQSPVPETGAPGGTLKVLIVAPSPDRSAGGAEGKLLRLLHQIDRSRLQTAVAFLGSGSLERASGELGFPTYALPPTRMRRIGGAVRTTRALAQVLGSERPDVVLGWNHKAQMLVSPATRLAGGGAKVTWIQTDLPRGPAHRVATLMPASAILCVSEYVATAQARLRPHRPMFIVYPGVDPPERVPPEELEDLRTSLSIPAGRAVIGTVGRIEYRKRQDLLIRALAGLRDRERDVQGLILGGDAWDGAVEYRRELRQMIRDLGLVDRVTFTGYAENPAPYVQLMDVYVHTCPVEAFGNALAEAMAAGVASVAVGTAGPAEVIDHGHSGLLAARPDAGLVEESVERLLQDDDLRLRVAKSGQERQRELFSTQHMAAELDRRLFELAGSR